MTIQLMSKPIDQCATDLLVLGAWANEPLSGPVQVIDRTLGGVIQQALERREFTGEIDSCFSTYTLGRLSSRRVLVVGLGNRQDCNLDRIRNAYGTAARQAEVFKAATATAELLGSAVLGEDSVVQAAAEGLLLGLWRFSGYQKEPPHAVDVEVTLMVSAVTPNLEERCRRGKVLAESANLARQLGSEPANLLYPEIMAIRAQDVMRQCGLPTEVLDESQLATLGMGGILGVGQGSVHPPRMVVIRYQGGGDKTLALVGKGITFDSGGLSLKPSAGMEEMKYDMLGAAAVLGALQAISQLAPTLNVIGILCLAENMPSGTALHPGDVVKAFNGKTLEVGNTDAEGRVVLADGVSYAAHLGADWIVDAATLTGAAIIVLGHEATALVATDDGLANMVLAAGREAGERIWRLPIYPEYKKLYKSEVADVKNDPGRDAGTITGGMIIAEFAGETPFAHLDIAGTAWRKETPLNAKFGPTGTPVRTLVHLAFKLAES